MCREKQIEAMTQVVCIFSEGFTLWSCRNVNSIAASVKDSEISDHYLWGGLQDRPDEMLEDRSISSFAKARTQQAIIVDVLTCQQKPRLAFVDLQTVTFLRFADDGKESCQSWPGQF